ncbi:MAG TPA: primosomal protein N' [Rhodanobacteraceae bacterium]|nr:primosomal protein N' [Rhodanobacteraceae bacterium]
MDAHVNTLLRIALPAPLPRSFDYLPPRDHALPPPGSRIEVPFGRARRVGIVVAQVESSDVAREQLKPALRVLDDAPLFTSELLANLVRAGDYWCGAVGEVLFGALPSWLRDGKPPPRADDAVWQLTVAGRNARDARSRRGSSAQLLDILAEAPQRGGDLDALLPGWRAAARRLREAGLIECVVLAQSIAWTGKPPIHALNREQSAVVERMLGAEPGFRAWLLDGVTGSGKTEIYLELIERALHQGKQSLVLVPEIGLVPQMLRRLRARFDAPIALLHSNLAEGDRARAWLAALNGEAAIVLGTRSAAFAPLAKPGLIVVDEEHDSSYKQQEGGFRYHARDFALMRAQALDIPIVLGSATPSLESLANVEAQRYARVSLRTRVHARPGSPVHVLDLRGLKMQHGLSPALLDALDACIARGEQALVFKNRRGYAPVLLCHACGWHAGCPRCERPLTVHRGRARLICHHCGHAQAWPRQCPQCSAQALAPQGHGTERLEEALRARYPEIPVLRVDRESTRRRDAFEKLLDQLSDGKPAIVVGTQMLAKGHDLPNLTTVAIVGVDEGLHSVDFHACEKLSQLIVQVAGRAGRADRPGEVWLQTHEPQHPLLTTLLRGGYPAAAAQQLGERRASGLPPYAHMALLRAEANVRAVLDGFLEAALAAFPASEAVQANGPLPAPMPLRAGRHRAQLLVESTQRAPLRHALLAWWPQLYGLPQPRGLRWSLDIDPVDVY